MRSLFTLPSVLVGMAYLGACGSVPDGSAVAEAALMETATMSAAEIAQDVSCWLRNATMEDALQRPSPLGETEIVFDGHVGKICYGRPSAKERVVEGGLIPFGEPWRLGANEATAIHLPFPASVGGVELEPGSYSIYVVGGESEWQFVLNSNAERWGIPINDAIRVSDVGTFTQASETLAEPVEQLTIDWEPQGADSGYLVVKWGTTKVPVEVRLLDHDH